ncbi:acyltransferase [Franconibacter daqui]|uniref:acyltransferase n=1 Tax=Franconibacter daqui TaxID=2047724 RepID=UPI0030D35B9D
MLSALKRLLFKIRFARLYKNKVKLGTNVFIHENPTFIIRNAQLTPSIFIGSNVYIGRHANLHTSSQIIIGDNCVLSDYVYLSTLSHGINPLEGPILQQPDYDKGQIILGENCFLGFNAKVLPGVTLGEWTIVGAGAVVTKSFAGYCMIAGNPAKIIKKYNSLSRQWESYNND